MTFTGSGKAVGETLNYYATLNLDNAVLTVSGRTVALKISRMGTDVSRDIFQDMSLME